MATATFPVEGTQVGRKQVATFAIFMLLLACYASFLTADVFTGKADNIYSVVIKHIAGLLCFVLTLMIGRDCHDARDRLMIQIALGLAFLADIFMGILGQTVIGIGIFFFVQITLVLRHMRDFTWNRKEWIAAACVYLPIGTILLAMSPLLAKANLLLPSILYTTVLATSVWMGIGTMWRPFYWETIARIIAVAVVAFFFCDLNVGLMNELKAHGTETFQQFVGLSDHPDFAKAAQHTLVTDVSNAIPPWVKSAIGIFVWYFYLPALLLLAMSGFRLEFLRSLLPVIPDERGDGRVNAS